MFTIKFKFQKKNLPIRVVQEAQSTRHVHEDGADLYREQYVMAMEDGVITNMERSMLRLTAKALGLSIEQIQAIESEIGIPQHSEE